MAASRNSLNHQYSKLSKKEDIDKQASSCYTKRKGWGTMNRQNPEMTSKLREILEDPQYHDPRQFTTTLYDENGRLILDIFEWELHRIHQDYMEAFVGQGRASKLSQTLSNIERKPLDTETPRWEYMSEQERELASFGYQLEDENGTPYQFAEDFDESEYTDE